MKVTITDNEGFTAHGHEIQFAFAAAKAKKKVNGIKTIAFHFISKDQKIEIHQYVSYEELETMYHRYHNTDETLENILLELRPHLSNEIFGYKEHVKN